MLLKKGDSLLKIIPKKDIKVYVQTAQKILTVLNENFPDSVDLTYNLLEQNNKPFVYIEIPYSESGDWFNRYIYYFDTIGDTRVIKIISSFFNSECVADVLTEETTLLYNSNFNEILKIYKIYDDKGNPVKDTTKCIFNYRFEYPLYSNYSKSPLGHK